MKTKYCVLQSVSAISISDCCSALLLNIQAPIYGAPDFSRAEQFGKRLAERPEERPEERPDEKNLLQLN